MKTAPTEFWAEAEKLDQYGKTPDTNYPRSRKGRFLPTDGNQLATWLPENTWAVVWSRDANEAEGKVESGPANVLRETEINEGDGGGAVLENGERIKWEMMYGGHAVRDWRSPERLEKQRTEGKNICWWRTSANLPSARFQCLLDIFNLRPTCNHLST